MIRHAKYMRKVVGRILPSKTSVWWAGQILQTKYGCSTWGIVFSRENHHKIANFLRLPPSEQRAQKIFSTGPDQILEAWCGERR